MTREEQVRVIMQVKLEVEAIHLAGDMSYATLVRRMPLVLERTAVAVGMSLVDPWLKMVVRAWENRT